MEIIIINGSPRKNGATAYILHEIEKCLLKQGAAVSFYDLCDQKMAICNGCGACYKIGHCVINDDAEKLSIAIEKADGVVIGSSTMASNISGLLKVFVDRGHFVIEQLLKKKYAVSVSIFENYGGNDTAKVINKLLTFSGAKLCGTIKMRIRFNSKYALNSVIQKEAEKNAVRLHNAIRKGKNYPLQSIKQKIVFEAGIKPFVMRKGKCYDGVQNRWKKIEIV